MPACAVWKPRMQQAPLEGSNAVSQSVRMIGISLFGGNSADKMNEKLLEMVLMLNTGKLVHGGASPPMQAQSPLFDSRNWTQMTPEERFFFRTVCQLAAATLRNETRWWLSLYCPVSGGGPT